MRAVLALVVSVLVGIGSIVPTSSGASGVGALRSNGGTTASPSGSAATSTPSTASTASTAASTAADVAAVDATAVSAAVDQMVSSAADQGVSEQVVVLNRSTGKTFASAGDGSAVPAMSLVKVLIALDVIASAGGVDNVDADTLAQLRTMIATSDDEIASDLYADYGGSQLIDRIISDYGMSSSSPSPEEEYWGDVRITAADYASMLYQALKTPGTGTWLAAAMTASTDTAADGFDQDFGMNAISAAGSKQGWGCCLGGVVALHSAGFTSNEIVVVLSTSYPDQDSSALYSSADLAADPGAQTALAMVSATALAAVTGKGD